MTETRSKPSTPASTQGTPNTIGGPENWAMQSLNNLREDLKEYSAKTNAGLDRIDLKIDGVDNRLKIVEGRITRLLWVTGTIGTMLIVMYGGYELLNSFFDVNLSITNKKDG